jgi:hypothetical protein
MPSVSDSHKIEDEIQKQPRGRKPIGPRAMTAAERKREQRSRQETAVFEQDSGQWTEATCLQVLTSLRWRGGPIERTAWEQLGRLRGFIL